MVTLNMAQHSTMNSIAEHQTVAQCRVNFIYGERNDFMIIAYVAIHLQKSTPRLSPSSAPLILYI